MERSYPRSRFVPEAKCDIIYGLCLANSRSMQNLQADCMQGFNHLIELQREYLKKLAEEQHITTRSMVLGVEFQETVEVLLEPTPLQNIPRVTPDVLCPLGSFNAVRDGIMGVIELLEKSLEKYGDARTSVQCLILADAFDNASETAHHTVFTRIAEKLEEGWNFIFLGGNQDAIKTGQKYGLHRDNCLTFGTQPGALEQAFIASGIAMLRHLSDQPSAFSQRTRGMCAPAQARHSLHNHQNRSEPYIVRFTAQDYDEKPFQYDNSAGINQSR